MTGVSAFMLFCIFGISNYINLLYFPRYFYLTPSITLILSFTATNMPELIFWLDYVLK